MSVKSLQKSQYNKNICSYIVQLGTRTHADLSANPVCTNDTFKNYKRGQKHLKEPLEVC